MARDDDGDFDWQLQAATVRSCAQLAASPSKRQQKQRERGREQSQRVRVAALLFGFPRWTTTVKREVQLVAVSSSLESLPSQQLQISSCQLDVGEGSDSSWPLGLHGNSCCAMEMRHSLPPPSSELLVACFPWKSAVAFSIGRQYSSLQFSPLLASTSPSGAKQRKPANFPSLLTKKFARVFSLPETRGPEARTCIAGWPPIVSCGVVF